MKEITGQSKVCSISLLKAKTMKEQKQQQKETYVRINFSWYDFLYKLFIARKSSEALVLRQVSLGLTLWYRIDTD